MTATFPDEKSAANRRFPGPPRARRAWPASAIVETGLPVLRSTTAIPRVTGTYSFEPITTGEPVGFAASFTGPAPASPPPPSAFGTTVRAFASTSQTIDLPGAGA